MNNPWLDSQTDSDAASREDSFWSAINQSFDAGEFWADRIKRYRDEPSRRLQMAMDNLPLPAAFRETAVAIRSIIRAKRKASESYTEELGLLYWLAAIDSFILPYADRLQEPGYNVASSIPGRKLRSLSVDYHTLGYERLELLNTTDKKWLVELHGEPKSHTTLNRLCRELWDEYEGKLIKQRRMGRSTLQGEFLQLGHNSTRTAFTKKLVKAAIIILAIFIFIIIVHLLAK